MIENFNRNTSKEKNTAIEIVKYSGERDVFSIEKFKNSLKFSGANKGVINKIASAVVTELYPGITTKEIYKKAFQLLKKEKGAFASRYKLKKAIYELGPTGFPFEKFISLVFKYSGYKTQTGKIYQGLCVTHEVDLIAKKENEYGIGECKFRSEEGRKCDVKTPLYIHSRFEDILNYYIKNPNLQPPNKRWLITNTRFSKDAIQYGRCVGLNLLSWDSPKGEALKDRIDRLRIYPITVSTLLTKREKQQLLNRDVVICRQVLKDNSYLTQLGVSEKRKKRILIEMELLCGI